MVHIDRFIAAHEAAWSRLSELSAAARRSPRRLAGGDVEELVRLYQQASGHLAHARAAYDDPALDARLTAVVAGANAAIYGARPRPGGALRRFFGETFPAAVWGSRRFLAVSAAALLVPAVALGLWLGASEEALDAAVDPARRAELLASDFVDYYSQQPAEQFSARVLTNNVQVSLVAFALGCALCVPGILVLAYNGANIGMVGGVFVDAGDAGTFLGHIAPHGLLELTGAVIAGAAGLRVGWAAVAPGDRRRSDALAEEGRAAVVLVLGCVPVFVAAGIIEGFVTPAHTVPLAVRALVGVVAWLPFVAWVLARGRALEPPTGGQRRPVALASR